MFCTQSRVFVSRQMCDTCVKTFVRYDEGALVLQCDEVLATGLQENKCSVAVGADWRKNC